MYFALYLWIGFFSLAISNALITLDVVTAHGTLLSMLAIFLRAFLESVYFADLSTISSLQIPTRLNRWLHSSKFPRLDVQNGSGFYSDQFLPMV
jgi:hypothetical protein